MSDQQLLKRLFYNPRTGLRSGGELYRLIREGDLDKRLKEPLTLQEVKEFVANQATTQINRSQAAKPEHFTSIVARDINTNWQCDLADFQNFARVNKNTRYILVCIDVYSRYVWARPLRTKTGPDVAKALESVFEEAKASPENLNSDNGGEFLNKHVQKLLKERNIVHWLADPGDHRKQGIVERFNRTLRHMIQLYQTANGTQQWLGILPSTVENYNNAMHSGIKAVPMKVYSGDAQPTSKNHRPDVLSEGTRVRMIKTRGMFDKASSTKQWSKNVYQIVGHELSSYKVKKVSTGKVDPYSYRRYELLVINASEDNTGSTRLKEQRASEGRKHKHDAQSKRKLDREGL
jgi:transposase InsO family protein